MTRQNRRRFINSLAGTGMGITALWWSAFKHQENKKKRPKDLLPVIDEVDICVLGGSCTAGNISLLGFDMTGLSVLID